MHRLTPVDDNELKVQIELNGQLVRDDAAELMLLYTEGTRGGQTMEQAYETFRNKLTQRWQAPINAPTAYLVVEAIVKITNDLKKKHIDSVPSQSSVSPSPGSTPTQEPSTRSTLSANQG